MFFRFFRAVKMSAEINKRKSNFDFKDEWLQHKDWKAWIKKVPDDEQKACYQCVWHPCNITYYMDVLDIHVICNILRDLLSLLQF